MVRAILEGRKTQTRRVVKLPSWSTQDWDDFDPDEPSVICKTSGCMPDLPCPYGKPGDRLWVRETFYIDVPDDDPSRLDSTYYRADGECCQQIPECQCGDVGKPKWRPSIFMPRWASRITLDITNVRVERLQDISEADAQAEGMDALATVAEIKDGQPHTYRTGFHILWDIINGKKYPWESNPFVWVIEFAATLTTGA